MKQGADASNEEMAAMRLLDAEVRSGREEGRGQRVLSLLRGRWLACFQLIPVAVSNEIRKEGALPAVLIRNSAILQKCNSCKFRC